MRSIWCQTDLTFRSLKIWEEMKMRISLYANSKHWFLLPVVLTVLCVATITAQNTNDKCRQSVIPVESEPPAKIFIDPPLAGPLASRGVVVIQYCTENLHIVPVFGAKALEATPRVGHLHVRVDDASWVWAEASGNPIILLGLAPGPHKVSIELVNANHQTLDKGVVTFVIPKTFAAMPPETGPSSVKPTTHQ